MKPGWRKTLLIAITHASCQSRHSDQAGGAEWCGSPGCREADGPNPAPPFPKAYTLAQAADHAACGEPHRRQPTDHYSSRCYRSRACSARRAGSAGWAHHMASGMCTRQQPTDGLLRTTPKTKLSKPQTRTLDAPQPNLCKLELRGSRMQPAQPSPLRGHRNVQAPNIQQSPSDQLVAAPPDGHKMERGHHTATATLLSRRRTA